MTTLQSTRPLRTPKRASTLSKGFDSLTLDPSPRLRRAREAGARENPVTQAWVVVSRAMSRSIRVVGETLHP